MSSGKESEENEYKAKEELYSLYFELTSEIKGEKIEIDEEEYAEKVRSSTMEELIQYIKESIQILYSKLLNKQQKRVDPKEFQVSQIEAQLRKYEEQRKADIKKIFQHALQKEALELRIDEYMEMEDEFEEMKSKYKYDEGKFLENDRKDNEIEIVRRENTNLKKEIDKNKKQRKLLVDKVKEQRKIIQELKNKLRKVEEEKAKIELQAKSQSQSTRNQMNLDHLDKLQNASTKNENSKNKNDSFCLNKNNTSTAKRPFHLLFLSPYDRSNKNKNDPNSNSHIRLINTKKPKVKKSQSQKNIFVINKNISCDIKNMSIKSNGNTKKGKGKTHHRNNSMSTILDQKKMNLFSKYFCRGGKMRPKNAKKVGPLSISQGSLSKKSKSKMFVKNSSSALDSKTAMNYTSCSTKKLSVVNSNGKVMKEFIKSSSKSKGKI
ncbi:MAG: hypothetical protein MJ252_12805 [archaeon]|nr:hypothetical protein [archaeon]